MNKIIVFLLLAFTVSSRAYNQTSEIFRIQIDSIGIRENSAGNTMVRNPTPGATAVLDLRGNKFSVSFSGELIAHEFGIISDSTSKDNPNSKANRMIRANGMDSHKNPCVLIFIFGTKSQVFKSFIFFKGQSMYYTGRIIGDLK